MYQPKEREIFKKRAILGDIKTRNKNKNNGNEYEIKIKIVHIRVG